MIEYIYYVLVSYLAYVIISSAICATEYNDSTEFFGEDYPVTPEEDVEFDLLDKRLNGWGDKS